ncbi:hypothetical protein D9M73_209080 [compost metagenome]
MTATRVTRLLRFLISTGPAVLPAKSVKPSQLLAAIGMGLKLDVLHPRPPVVESVRYTCGRASATVRAGSKCNEYRPILLPLRSTFRP